MLYILLLHCKGTILFSISQVFPLKILKKSANRAIPSVIWGYYLANGITPRQLYITKATPLERDGFSYAPRKRLD